MAAGHDQHSSDKQLSADMTRWVGTLRTCGNSGGFSEDVVSAPTISRSSAIASARLCRSAACRHAVPCNAVSRSRSLLAMLQRIEY
jgi:hypothetical protein